MDTNGRRILCGFYEAPDSWSFVKFVVMNFEQKETKGRSRRASAGSDDFLGSWFENEELGHPSFPSLPSV